MFEIVLLWIFTIWACAVVFGIPLILLVSIAINLFTKNKGSDMSSKSDSYVGW
jgi:hypothetical protein